MPPSGQSPVSLVRVLESLQDEVASLATMSEGLQDALSHVLGAAPLTSTDLVAVQNLDVIAQHLGAVATYLQHLSTQIPADWSVRPELAAAMINLSSLAHRLSLGVTTEEFSDGGGDAFLF